MATSGDDRIRVVLTMRRNYLYACDSFPEQSQRVKGEPSSSYCCTRCHAKAFMQSSPSHWTWPASLSATERISPGRRSKTWATSVANSRSEARGRGPDLVAAYGSIGRVEGALAQTAKSVFNYLSPDEQRCAETLFVRLVRSGEGDGATRRVVRLEEFDSPTRTLAEKLSQRRLLMMREELIEIAHEQLATEWQRIRARHSGSPARRRPASAAAAYWRRRTPASDRRQSGFI